MIQYKKYHYQKIQFIQSVSNIDHLPGDYGIEIALIGRSNSGKSSALNALTNQKKLAYTSKKPGCTKLINIFEIIKDIRIIDLPGYGYAEVPKMIKFKWHYLLNEYFQKRKCLKGVIFLMDIRHSFKTIDFEILRSLIKMNYNIFILLTKADKLPLYQQKQQIMIARKKKEILNNNIQVEIFSKFKHVGIKSLKFKLDEWLNDL